MNAPIYELGDWFSNNIPNWEAWLAGIKDQPRVRAIEIGSCEGRSARWLIEHVLTDPSSGLTCVDIEIRPRLMSNLSPWFGRVGMRQMPSQEYWRNTLGYAHGMADLVYLDGSHRAKDVLTDSVSAWQALRVGGILIFDDYPLIESLDREWDRPGPAIDAFLSAYRLELELLPDVPHAKNPGWQKAVRKLR